MKTEEKRVVSKSITNFDSSYTMEQIVKQTLPTDDQNAQSYSHKFLPLVLRDVYSNNYISNPKTVIYPANIIAHLIGILAADISCIK